MKLTRRSFLKLGVASGVGTLFTALGVRLNPVWARTYRANMGTGTAVQGVCPFCSVGCSIKSYVGGNNQVVHVEGNVISPLTGGALCAKGSAAYYLVNTPRSLIGRDYLIREEVTRTEACVVRTREPKATKWQPQEYGKAMRDLIRDFVATRDSTFDAENGRTSGIAVLGGAQLTNEECYSLAKLARSLGIVYLDSEARESYLPAMRALSATIGWPAMTNQYLDVRNSSCVLIIGANPAENQPVAMRHILDAQAAGAKIVVVDPRFTRSAFRADLFVRIRPGTDLASPRLQFGFHNVFAHRQRLFGVKPVFQVVECLSGSQNVKVQNRAGRFYSGMTGRRRLSHNVEGLISSAEHCG